MPPSAAGGPGSGRGAGVSGTSRPLAKPPPLLPPSVPSPHQTHAHASAGLVLPPSPVDLTLGVQLKGLLCQDFLSSPSPVPPLQVLSRGRPGHREVGPCQQSREGAARHLCWRRGRGRDAWTPGHSERTTPRAAFEKYAHERKEMSIKKSRGREIGRVFGSLVSPLNLGVGLALGLEL